MLSGKFQADFQSFYDACDTAVVKLVAFEGGSAKVTAQLNKTAEAFSGRRIISEATLMAEVFERAGGSAKFTENELARMGAVGAEAIAKLHATSKPVPANIQAMADAAQAANPKVTDLGTSFRQFDSVLASVGIHVGPEIKGLTELGAAAGKSVGSMGLLATAGLAAGAAIGGWKLGRVIAEVFDLDTKIAGLTARALGLGNLAAQEAGAGLDVLARASFLAKHEITDFAEAQRIIIEANKGFADSMNTSGFRTAQWRKEIAQVTDDGKLVQFTRDLQSHNSTTEELTRQYGVSARGQEFFKRSLEATAEAIKKDTDFQIQQHAKADAAAKAYAATLQSMVGTINDIGKVLGYATAQAENLGRVQADEAALNKFNSSVYRKSLEDIALQAEKTYAAAQASSSGFSEAAKEHFRGLRDTAVLAAAMWETSFVDAGEASVIALDSVTEAAKRAVDESKKAADEAKKAAETAKAAKEQAAADAKAFAARSYSSTPGDSMIRNSVVSDYRPDGTPAPRAMGGPVSAGDSYMVGERGPELFMPKTSGTIVPNGAGSGLVVNIAAGAVVMNYPLVNDPRAKTEIAGFIGDAIMERWKNRGGRVPSGA